MYPQLVLLYRKKEKNMKMTKIYDTSSLLIKAEEIFDTNDKIVITNMS